MQNLGAGEPLYDFGTGDYRIYMKGGENFTHLASVWRVAPSFSYNIAAFNLGVEYELTAANYGDISADGSILDNSNLHQVMNHRLCLLVKYNVRNEKGSRAAPFLFNPLWLLVRR